MSNGIRFDRFTGSAVRVCAGTLAATLLALSVFHAAAQQPIPPVVRDRLTPFNRPPSVLLQAPCGESGQRCCRAPESAQNPALGPLVSCKQGLGCDLTSDTCVSPCGGVGQACCDGPETRALQWTADGKVYSPDPQFLREMCTASACDRRTHRCFVCGNADGAPCCPPDAAQATASCIGERLYCQYDTAGLYISGTCRMCGARGRAPCTWGCDPGLGVRQEVCELCSREGQPPCDEGCQPGLDIMQGLCRACGSVGQIPCNAGCRGALGLRAGHCVVCGGSGQEPCDNGCRSGTAW
jgi:hypothetical protein